MATAVEPTVCALMKALSTAWQPHLQCPACPSLSEAGQLFSLPLPFGGCPFAISAFCPPGLAAFAITTRLRKSELFNVRQCLLRPLSISSQGAPGQGFICCLIFLSVSRGHAAQRGLVPRTPRAELPRPGSSAGSHWPGHSKLGHVNTKEQKWEFPLLPWVWQNRNCPASGASSWGWLQRACSALGLLCVRPSCSSNTSWSSC